MNASVPEEELLVAVEVLRFVADLCACQPEEMNLALCRFTSNYYPAAELRSEALEVARPPSPSARLRRRLLGAGPVSALAKASDMTVLDEVVALCRRLRLKYVREQLTDVVLTARAQRWDPAEAPRVLLVAEAEGRDRSTIESRRQDLRVVVRWPLFGTRRHPAGAAQPGMGCPGRQRRRRRAPGHRKVAPARSHRPPRRRPGLGCSLVQCRGPGHLGAPPPSGRHRLQGLHRPGRGPAEGDRRHRLIAYFC